MINKFVLASALEDPNRLKHLDLLPESLQAFHLEDTLKSNKTVTHSLAADLCKCLIESKLGISLHDLIGDDLQARDKMHSHNETRIWKELNSLKHDMGVKLDMILSQ